MSQHPKEVAAFIAWSKAMVQGATVERPKWKTLSRKKPGRGGMSRRKSRRRRTRRVRKHQEE